MFIPPEFLERLKRHLPLSQVIGRRIPVRRQGREYQALCPFHKEKSPSFTINDEKGFFHCFGCQAHGDAIGFIKDYERLTYPEAVERLAAEAGLALPVASPQDVARARARKGLEEAVAAAALWFRAQLHGKDGESARRYVEERGILPETCERFGIGYAPVAREGLKKALLAQGFALDVLQEAGLLAGNEEGQSFDRFRGRLMFPIHDAGGHAVAFGGRLLPSAADGGIAAMRAAKYVNSPETPLFKKGELLFAYHLARAQLARSDDHPCLVVEGYMDVVALHQAGFNTAVAPLGTAITAEQLALLWRIAKQPVICFDGDAAGKRASVKAILLALPALLPGNGLGFAALPPGQDPDSLTKARGPEAFRAVLAAAKPLSHMLWEHAQGYAPSHRSAEAKAALERRVMELAGRIQDATLQRHMRDYFRDQLYRLNRKSPEKPAGFRSTGLRNATPRKPYLSAPDPVLPQAANATLLLPEAADTKRHLARLEEEILLIFLLQPSLLHHGEVESRLSSLVFSHAPLDKLCHTLLDMAVDMESMDSDTARLMLCARGYDEMVYSLLHSKHIPCLGGFKRSVTEHPAFGLAAFRRAHTAHIVIRLHSELLDAERAYDAVLARPEAAMQTEQAGAQVETLRAQYLTLQGELHQLRQAHMRVEDSAVSPEHGVFLSPPPL